MVSSSWSECKVAGAQAVRDIKVSSREHRYMAAS